MDTHEDLLTVCAGVLDILKEARHVAPTIFTDLELKYLTEANTPGATAYRDQLNKILQHWPVETLLHEDIIAQLDQAGKTFRVLILKTTLTIPYTSVFLRLECGYWNSAGEHVLRAAMK